MKSSVRAIELMFRGTVVVDALYYIPPASKQTHRRIAQRDLVKLKLKTLSAHFIFKYFDVSLSHALIEMNVWQFIIEQ